MIITKKKFKMLIRHNLNPLFKIIVKYLVIISYLVILKISLKKYFNYVSILQNYIINISLTFNHIVIIN